MISGHCASDDHDICSLGKACQCSCHLGKDRPRPYASSLPYEGDDSLGVWVAICPVYGWDHAAVYNSPMAHVNCPFCWRFWGDELPCELRHYESGEKLV
jgi:hypothetical protein